MRPVVAAAVAHAAHVPRQRDVGTALAGAGGAAAGGQRRHGLLDIPCEAARLVFRRHLRHDGHRRPAVGLPQTLTVQTLATAAARGSHRRRLSPDGHLRPGRDGADGPVVLAARQSAVAGRDRRCAGPHHRGRHPPVVLPLRVLPDQHREPVVDGPAHLQDPRGRHDVLRALRPLSRLSAAAHPVPLGSDCDEHQQVEAPCAAGRRRDRARSHGSRRLERVDERRELPPRVSHAVLCRPGALGGGARRGRQAAGCAHPLDRDAAQPRPVATGSPGVGAVPLPQRLEEARRVVRTPLVDDCGQPDLLPLRHAQRLPPHVHRGRRGVWLARGAPEVHGPLHADERRDQRPV